MPAPEVGKPLPRAEDAYVDQSKWHGYVLADDGHGPHWRRVFRVEPTQSAALWQAIVELARTGTVTHLRPNPYGFGCGIQTELTFNGRTATVRLGWFYERPDAPPRLVSAYPTP
jgi:hypothetical protein